MGEEGAKGWAAWESGQGLTPHSVTTPGQDKGSTANGSMSDRSEVEEKGGWGEWVPLMPETPQEPKPAAESEPSEAAAVADEVQALHLKAARLTLTEHYSEGL